MPAWVPALGRLIQGLDASVAPAAAALPTCKSTFCKLKARATNP